MSDCFDHEADAYDSLHSSDWDYYNSDEEYVYSSRQQKTNVDPWYYHEWFTLELFHKEFPNSVLLTLSDSWSRVYTKLVPKSIIGKRESMFTYSTGVEVIKFLIHSKTFHNKLQEARVHYMWNGLNLRFVDINSPTHVVLLHSSNQQHHIAPINELTYHHWYKLDKS